MKQGIKRHPMNWLLGGVLACLLAACGGGGAARRRGEALPGGAGSRTRRLSAACISALEVKVVRPASNAGVS